ncbi:glycine betaine ABC transporter substrate-binding protein [Paenibacillus sp. JCM 10914]|uniref:glycine betaine ABC transporter substrate-binding protein n=1 Tax=Paenibacillus sp. JCM 10914 TaxID=1236974 RepID=UPI0003CC5A6E|nr:glycine betaine ABC transporter substrate-binding protein [Paenibacillus sp. JCM 10914]GAE08466.1 L-proline glycine betaine binding ABC transporter protein ProX [Paenibacillus sp. JCM 10914]
MNIKKLMVVFGLVASIGMVLSACGGGSGDGGNSAEGSKEITVSSKNFTENIILAHMMADLIEAKTDIKVTRTVNLGGSNVVWNALKNNEVQLFPDYTGTIVANYYQEETGTSEESLTRSRELMKEDGLAFLEPFGINNTYTLAVTQETAEKHNLKTFSDLAEVSDDMVLGVEFEFLDRDDGYPGIRELYGMNFKDSKGMDHGIMYQAIDNGETDVTNAYATDAQIAVHNLVILEDDKQFFPPYDGGPVIRQDTLDQYPELEEVLNLLGGQLTEADMQELNAQVDVEGLREDSVARDFLVQKGLIEE